MKRKYLLAVLIAAAMPLTSMAQDDDLYFNPKKEAKEKAERRALLQRQYAEQRARRDSVYRLFWSGSDRSVDEYNRGGRIFSHYENVGKDSLGNDIIQFHVGKGVAPDSIYDDAYFAQKYADRDEDFDLTLRDVGGNVFVKDYERKEHQDDKCDRYVCFVFFHDYIFEKIL